MRWAKIQDKNKKTENCLLIFACSSGAPACQTPRSRTWAPTPTLDAKQGQAAAPPSLHYSQSLIISLFHVHVLAHKSDSASCSDMPSLVPHLHAAVRKLNLQWLNDPVTQLPAAEGSIHTTELTDISALAWPHSPGCAGGFLLSYWQSPHHRIIWVKRHP